jgi:hypothetical protein
MRGGVLGYAAQAAPQIDAEIAEKGQFGTGTRYRALTGGTVQPAAARWPQPAAEQR